MVGKVAPCTEPRLTLSCRTRCGCGDQTSIFLVIRIQIQPQWLVVSPTHQRQLFTSDSSIQPFQTKVFRNMSLSSSSCHSNPPNTGESKQHVSAASKIASGSTSLAESCAKGSHHREDGGLEVSAGTWALSRLPEKFSHSKLDLAGWIIWLQVTEISLRDHHCQTSSHKWVNLRLPFHFLTPIFWC